MIRIGSLAPLLSALLLLAGCAHHSAPLALPEPTGSVLTDTAALLALADGATDDPLAVWRSDNPASETAPWRGRTLGPAYRRMAVAAGESLRIEQVFYAGQRAEIAAQASSGGQVALKIANPRAQAVCAQQLSPRGTCNFLPIYTERFSIELENSGSSSASVYIVFR